jgi:hypothetical protein
LLIFPGFVRPKNTLAAVRAKRTAAVIPDFGDGAPASGRAVI